MYDFKQGNGEGNRVPRVMM